MVDQSNEDTAPPLGRRARKALATRQALFQAGLAAFEHRPLNVVSVLDITEASDVAKGVFYLHFRGKDEYLIALWEHVQRQFLDALRGKLASCRSARTRVEVAVGHYHGRTAEAPRDCRFWLRMSSYFGDEIGEPGQMSALRHAYLRELASLLRGQTPEEVDDRAIRLATVLDGLGWGLISQTIQLGSPVLGRGSFVKTATAALRPHLLESS